MQIPLSQNCHVRALYCCDIRGNIHCDRRLICNFASTTVQDENPSYTLGILQLPFLEAADVMGTGVRSMRKRTRGQCIS